LLIFVLANAEQHARALREGLGALLDVSERPLPVIGV
jgi:hypothetical protein